MLQPFERASYVTSIRLPRAIRSTGSVPLGREREARKLYRASWCHGSFFGERRFGLDNLGHKVRAFGPALVG